MYARIRNFSIPISFQILKHIHEIIFGSVLYIFESYSDWIVSEVILLNRFGRCFRIINWSTFHLIWIRLCCRRRSNGIRKILCFCLKKVRVEYNLLSLIIKVVVFCSDIIDCNVTKYGHNNHALVNNRICCYLCRRRNDIIIIINSSNNPFFKNLASNKRILWHGSNSCTTGSKILWKLFSNCAVIIKSNKIHIELVSQSCNKRKIGCDRFPASILCIAIKPTFKILAFNTRIARNF